MASKGSLLVALLLLGSPVLAADAPERTKVLGSGIVGSVNVMTRWFTSEPSTDPLIIPTRESGLTTPEVIRRMMRLYFPRTKEDLLTYDFFFLACVDMTFFTPKQQSWIREALGEHPKGGISTRSTQGKYDTEWRDSLVSEAFPNDVVACLTDGHYKHGKTGPMVILDDASLPPIMSPFKDRLEPLFRSYTDAGPILLTVPKAGSTILSYTKNRDGIGYPIPGQLAHSFFWEWNRSTTFTFRDMVTSPFWLERGTSDSNTFAHDIIVNIVWFTTGRELPSDPFTVHEYRLELYSYRLRRSMMVGLLEFVEKFGALPTREYKELNRIEEIRAESAQAYLTSEYDAARDKIQTALGEFGGLEAMAAELKGRTLFWVYAVEWSITTATFLMAGVLLWALMVKRRMYREVAATRSSMLILL